MKTLPLLPFLGLSLALPSVAPAKENEKQSDPVNPNLALEAKASATSVYSEKYHPNFARDGIVPAPVSRKDLDEAWVAKGNKHPDGVDFTLEWEQPVTVAP